LAVVVAEQPGQCSCACRRRPDRDIHADQTHLVHPYGRAVRPLEHEARAGVGPKTLQRPRADIRDPTSVVDDPVDPRHDPTVLQRNRHAMTAQPGGDGLVHRHLDCTGERHCARLDEEVVDG
jgi:hypothetical protein